MTKNSLNERKKILNIYQIIAFLLNLQGRGKTSIVYPSEENNCNRIKHRKYKVSHFCDPSIYFLLFG